jgi:hypothetical protein
MRYENLSDEELIRFAVSSNNVLVLALVERLEMRLRDIDELQHTRAKRDPLSPRPHPDDRQLELF